MFDYIICTLNTFINKYFHNVNITKQTQIWISGCAYIESDPLSKVIKNN